MSKRSQIAYQNLNDLPAMSINQDPSGVPRVKKSKIDVHDKKVIEISSSSESPDAYMQEVTSGVGDSNEEKVASHGSSKDSGGVGRRNPQQVSHPRLLGVQEGWVLYVVHPDKGQFVINEGVVLVGDQQVVCGGARQGFFSAPVPVEYKVRLRENDSLGLPNDTVVFPNILMMAPVMRQLAEDAYDITIFGPGEITDPHEIPEDKVPPMSPPEDGGRYSVPRRRVAPTKHDADKKVTGGGVGGLELHHELDQEAAIPIMLVK